MLASRVRSLAIIVWGAVLVVLSITGEARRHAWVVFEWAVTITVLGFVAYIGIKALLQLADLWTVLSCVMMGMGIAGTYLVLKKRMSGLYFWALSNVGWIVIDLHAGVPAQAALFAVYLILSLYGVWEWKRKG